MSRPKWTIEINFMLLFPRLMNIFETVGAIKPSETLDIVFSNGSILLNYQNDISHFLWIVSIIIIEPSFVAVAMFAYWRTFVNCQQNDYIANACTQKHHFEMKKKVSANNDPTEPIDCFFPKKSRSVFPDHRKMWCHYSRYIFSNVSKMANIVSQLENVRNSVAAFCIIGFCVNECVCVQMRVIFHLYRMGRCFDKHIDR